MSARLTSSALIALVMMAPTLAHAQSETRISGDVYAGVGYSANPYGGVSGGSAQGSVYVQTGIRPKVEIKTQNSTFALAGDVQIQQYTHRYGTVDNYNVQLSYDGKPSEHLTTQLQLAYSNSRAGILSSSLFTDPGDTDPTGTDIGLLGTGTRKQRYSAQGGLGFQPSDRDKINVTAYFVASRYGVVTGNYDLYGGSIDYLRRLSSHAQIGIHADTSFTYYQGGAGNTKVYSLQASGTLDLSEAWKLSARLGGSALDRNSGGLDIAFSGNISACHKGGRTEFCLVANRATLPSAVTGTRVQTSVEANYKRRLTEHTNLTARVGYTDAELNGPLLNIPNRYLLSSVGLDRTVSKRVVLSSSLFYRSIFGSNGTRGDDYGGQIGVVLKFGDLQ